MGFLRERAAKKTVQSCAAGRHARKFDAVTTHGSVGQRPPIVAFCSILKR